jgi:hypothetical protein
MIEQRAGRVYPMKPGERDDEPLTPKGLASAVAEEVGSPRSRPFIFSSEFSAPGGTRGPAERSRPHA